MPDPLSLPELLHLPKEKVEGYILQLPASELSALREHLESFIRNSSAGILEQLSHSTLQSEKCSSGPLPFKGAEASSAVSALGRDSSLEDAKQILLEAQASITESLEKLHSAAQEEHILGQIEDSLRTTLRLIDHLDETCFSKPTDCDALAELLSQSLQTRTTISHINPPSCCTAISSRLKHAVDILCSTILSHVETIYLSNLVCLESPQVQKLYSILLAYSEMPAIVCKNFTTPLLHKLSDYTPLQILENVAVLVSRLKKRDSNSWLALLYQKLKIESGSAAYSNTFHQCLTVPLMNFLQSYSRSSIATLSYSQALHYLQGLYKIYSNASVDPWPGLKDALLLETKIMNDIEDSFKIVILVLKNRDMKQASLNTTISEFSDNLCQTLNLFLRPPAEVLSKDLETPCGYFVPALVDKVLTSLSSALHQLAMQLLIYKNEKFYNSLIGKLHTSLTDYVQTMSMVSGLLEFTDALPVLGGPQSVPQIQDLYFSTLKEYLGIFIGWLRAELSLR